ncbi:MAG: hypothetical protein V3V29_02120 [Acidimicrobiia bacterium]
MPTTRTASLLLALALIAAACSGDDATIDHLDPPADCRSAFAESPVPCGPGTDITRLIIDPAGPIVLTIELAEPPHFDHDFR